MTAPLWRRATVLTLGMATGLHYFFLQPLAAEARDMHAEQLDPTEIVLIVYDLRRLWIYVSSVMVAAGLVLSYNTSSARASPQQDDLLRFFLRDMLPSTLAMWLAYLVLGASPVQNLWHTLGAALYLIVLLQWDPLVRPPWPRHTLDRLSAATQRPRDLDARVSLTVVQTRCVVACTVLAHVLRLYDGGWQAQRWPVPTIVGATYGWILGPWCGILLVGRPERTSLVGQGGKEWST